MENYTFLKELFEKMICNLLEYLLKCMCSLRLLQRTSTFAHENFIKPEKWKIKEIKFNFHFVELV